MAHRSTSLVAKRQGEFISENNLLFGQFSDYCIHWQHDGKNHNCGSFGECGLCDMGVIDHKGDFYECQAVLESFGNRLDAVSPTGSLQIQYRPAST